MNLLKSAIQFELDTFYSQLQDTSIPQRELTQSAFTQARKKLKFEAFIKLNDEAISVFYDDDASIQRWQGYRLLAVDGTTLQLPNTAEVRKTFDAKEGEVPLGRLSELYDVMNDLVIGAEFSALEIGEAFHAELLLERAQPGDVVIYDRGYPSFYLMAKHRQAGIDYCMRTPIGRFNAVVDFVASGEQEKWVTIEPCHTAKKDCQRNDVSIEPLSVRLIRVELSSGEVEVLMTSLGDEIAHGEFAALYFQRWGIEEAYKHQKCRAELENWSGRTVHSVYQDIYAKLLTINLTTMCRLAAESQIPLEKNPKKYQYQINRTKALSKAKYHLVCAILNTQERLQQLLNWMAQDVEAIRPGRKSLRINPGRKKLGHHPNYKRSA